jgi:serine protease inhibitor
MEPASKMGLVSQDFQGIRPIGDQFSSQKHQQVAPDFARAINAASTDLFSKINDKRSVEHKNFVYFTPNLLAAFSMLLAGAQGDAQKALEEFLRVKDVEGDFHSSFGVWIDNLTCRSVAMSAELEKVAKEGNKFFYKQAQAVMTLNGVTIPTDAETRLGCYHPVQINFNDDSEAQAITNAWVEKQTEGKITNLVEDLPEETVLMLVTAALFQGNWKYPFDEKENSTETFYNSDGTMVKFTMMNQGLDDLRLYSDWKKEVTICELPYHGDLSLLVVNCGGKWNREGVRSAAKLEKFMKPENILDMLEHFDERAKKSKGLSIGIPKLKVKDKTDLFKELADDPMVQAITSSNWSGSLVNYHKKTHTSELVSEVQYQMDEVGTQIAAASYSPTAAESCDPEFKMNSAFGVILFDNQTKTILGMGKFLKLEGEETNDEN